MELHILDIGSNSFQLQRTKVARGRVETLARHKRFFKLGTRLDASQRFSESTIASSCECIAELLALVPRGGLVCGIATAAVRRAANGAELVAELTRRFDVPISVLSGEREAELAYLGAWTQLAPQVPGQLTGVVDIGGGSTEIACGTQSHLRSQCSLRLGALDFQNFRPATLVQALNQAGFALDQVMGTEPIFRQPVERLAFASGTARAVRQVAEGLGISRGFDMSLEQLRATVIAILVRGRTDLVIAGCPEERVDVVAGVSCLMLALAQRSGAASTCTVDTGVREGAAIRFYELTELSRAVPFGAFLDQRSAPFPQDAA